MTDPIDSASSLPDEVAGHYDRGLEHERLLRGAGRIEHARTLDLLDRFLPRPPACILDVGGGSGVYAGPLARAGYEVHLVDPVPLHLTQARAMSDAQPDRPLASVRAGDARALDVDDGTADAVLLLGPLYHLTERDDRIAALREAARVLNPGGLLLAASISRFASTLDGLARGLLDDPVFARIAARDRVDGQHRNPGDHPAYFTTAFFHHPDELRDEVTAAGFRTPALIGLEGPTWLPPDLDAWLDDPARRALLLETLRSVEREPSLLGVSAHVVAVATRPG